MAIKKHIQAKIGVDVPQAYIKISAFNWSDIGNCSYTVATYFDESARRNKSIPIEMERKTLSIGEGDPKEVLKAAYADLKTYHPDGVDC